MKIIELHNWFCKESRKFVGVGYGKLFTPFSLGTVYYNRKYKRKDFLYFPIAYIKFMWYSLANK